MNPEELKCLCGHMYRFHFMITIDKQGNEKPVCGGCDFKDGWKHPFKLDNLDYLEKLNEELS